MTTTSTLTKKQKEVYDFVKSYVDDSGIAPTIEEIRKKLKLKAVSTIHEHISSLREKGYLDRVKGKLVIKNKIPKIIRIPIIGKLVAYKPSSNIKDSFMFSALRVEGNSMSEEGIFDGDIVIIQNK
jgi:repressor LexA